MRLFVLVSLVITGLCGGSTALADASAPRAARKMQDVASTAAPCGFYRLQDDREVSTLTTIAAVRLTFASESDFVPAAHRGPITACVRPSVTPFDNSAQNIYYIGQRC